MEQSIRMPVFDGTSGWNSWKESMVVLLCLKGLTDFVERTYIERERENRSWMQLDEDRGDGQAIMYLRFGLAEELRSQITGKSAYTAWRYLNDAYAIQDSNTIMNRIHNLVNLQMDEDGDDNVRTYMSRFDAMLLEINTNDLTVDSIFALMFISGLSSRFHSLVAGYGR
ncbi:hypothetical protein IWW51_002891, partial [Coemansia sp. RSA 2702]